MFGALLLMMPFAHYGNLDFIDAVFTATSATCVTGLIVKDVANDFTFYGQLIILILIQIGGIGYLAFATFAVLVFGKQLTHRDYTILKASASYDSAKGVLVFLKQTIAFIFLIEVGCGLILTSRFMLEMPFIDALWAGFFHAVSAFNNAGFSVFKTNLIDYRADFVVVFVVTTLVMFGGIGYVTVLDVYNYKKGRLTRTSINTRVTIVATLFLIFAAFLLFISLEWNNTKTIGGFSFYDKVLAAYFYSINLRTAGFNSIDLASISDSTIFLSTIFMIIGGGVGGTAGGIKVTTFAVIVLSMWHSLKGHSGVSVFKRTVPHKTVMQAATTIYIASFYLIISTITLSETQSAPFLNILYEVASAFGTVGVSTGDGGVLSLSAKFDAFGKINIILLMLMGRIGVVAFTLILVGKIAETRFKYTEGRILI